MHRQMTVLANFNSIYKTSPASFQVVVVTTGTQKQYYSCGMVVIYLLVPACSRKHFYCHKRKHTSSQRLFLHCFHISFAMPLNSSVSYCFLYTHSYGRTFFGAASTLHYG